MEPNDVFQDVDLMEWWETVERKLKMKCFFFFVLFFLTTYPIKHLLKHQLLSNSYPSALETNFTHVLVVKWNQILSARC